MFNAMHLLCLQNNPKNITPDIKPCPADPGYIMYPAFANSEDPDQLASSEANWSGSALFEIQYVNLYQQCGSSYLISWKFDKV